MLLSMHVFARRRLQYHVMLSVCLFFICLSLRLSPMIMVVTYRSFCTFFALTLWLVFLPFIEWRMMTSLCSYRNLEHGVSVDQVASRLNLSDAQARYHPFSSPSLWNVFEFFFHNPVSFTDRLFNILRILVTFIQLSMTTTSSLHWMVEYAWIHACKL